MDSARIIEGLAPFLGSNALSTEQLAQISAHLELLLKWNPRINLTSIRSADLMVSRHFGESLFAASKLKPLVPPAASLVDFGSGAGFPGIPTKIWIPELDVTLIESREKKATFWKSPSSFCQFTAPEYRVSVWQPHGEFSKA